MKLRSLVLSASAVLALSACSFNDTGLFIGDAKNPPN